MVTKIILALIIIVNAIYAIVFLRDYFKKKDEQKISNNILLAFSSFFIFFFSSFGMSDFALSTILYRKKKLISDKLLPGTLNAQGAIPFAIMALAFISVIKIDIMTLAICIISQVIGAYVGPQIVVRLSAKIIRRFIGWGLAVAAAFILAAKFNLIPSGGTAMSLSGIKLFIAASTLFTFGVLNNIGIGAFAPTMVIIYALGMNPAAAFPIMMGAAAFSVPVASMQFIKYGQYNRKITLFCSTFGVLGVIAAVYLFQGLDVSILQWFLAGILFYSAYVMLFSGSKAKTEEALPALESA